MVSEEQNSDIELASEVIPVPQVQPEIEAPAPKPKEDPNEKANDIPHGKSRQRKRALFAAILKQMEFYFSDSNLSKDRFLAELIKESPDVPLDTFLKFNKIRSLTTDVNKVSKALRKSTMLQVSEDGKMVRRMTPVVQRDNVDECTVYVQRLPSDADHEWLISLFSEYGPVAYVSIPKFKSTQKIKGFAFVEFETPEGATKCLKAFRAKGCELPSQTSPAEVLSITTFAEEEKQEQNGVGRKHKIEKNEDLDEPKVKKRKESIKSDEKECDNNDKEISISFSDSNAQKEEKRGKKRKNRLSMEEVQNSETDSQSISNENSKKQKGAELEPEAESDNSNKNETNKDNKKKKKIKVEVESESENSIKNETNKESIKNRKKLKTNISKLETEPEIIIKKEDIKKEYNDEAAESTNDEGVPEKKKKKIKVEVESESEYSIKNETNKESIKNRKKLKTDISKYEAEPEIVIKKEDNDEAAESTNDEGVPEKKKKKKRKRKHHAPYEVLQTVDMGLQVMGKKDWKKLRNKYLELQRAKMKQLKQNIRRARWNQWGDRNRMESEQEETTTNTKKENASSSLEFTPNVIVKIELNEPCIDPKGFKTELKSSSSNIKYIDVKEGSHEAYVRCDSSEAAAALAQKSNEEKHLRVLTGDEELYYWDKITRDREEKINNKIRVNQKGRNKLLKKAEKELGKHIKFDEV